MTCRIGDTYVGLTDDPDRRRIEHGDPPDWRVEELFSHQPHARAWEQGERLRPDHCGGTDENGWHYGYKYTVTNRTQEMTVRPTGRVASFLRFMGKRG